jgi:hypothetical protein
MKTNSVASLSGHQLDLAQHYLLLKLILFRRHMRVKDVPIELQE